VAGHAHPEARREPLNRQLERRVIERNEPSAALAYQVVMVLSARMLALEPRLSISHLDPLDQAVLDQQIEHTVDAGAAGRAPGRAKLVLDLHGAQCARLRREQRYHSLTGAAALEAGAGKHGAYVLGPHG
jgi:hypothetical protein